jgi:hypothetical protein
MSTPSRPAARDSSKFLVVRQAPPSAAITHIVVDQDWFEILNRVTGD